MTWRQFRAEVAEEWAGPDRVMDLPERGPATPNAAGPVPVYVSEDTRIIRPDLGPNCYTWVPKGHRIPFGLEGYERVDNG